ncbi:MAG: ribbon-helix-helix protein, CopG family [Eubacteriales bacterium]|nr:ribbon-helix-helix protein, CopG family [Eubacterium sp.]MDD7179951.1 ribbon-helix-helix protein, CopG family [Eubacterium sp.]MDY5494240.1 ribbon-helix-helix protein, CopG family [Eubacteriales bacterium]CDE17721.1 toxin-antitoxin system protein [Eubacterium sp. CAG:841]
MKPLKEKISITIDSDLLEALRAEAEKDDRSLSQYINLILKERANPKNRKDDKESGSK